MEIGYGRVARWASASVVIAAGLAGCLGGDGNDVAVVPVAPSNLKTLAAATLEHDLQEVLLDAKSGDIITLPAGTFNFKRPLSLTVSGVTIRGAGNSKATGTTLSFAAQAQGSDGFTITGADNVTLESFAVEDTLGDGIVVKGAKNITMRKIRMEWTAGAKEGNGAYGIYPVTCDGVLVEDSIVRGAADAGLYIGQSNNIVARRNKVYENVAGLEIENSTNADVYENEAYGNTGGILVFNLPGLQVKNGKRTKVHDNNVHDNNLTSFAKPGSIVSETPAGTGIMIVANSQVEIYKNTIRNHKSASVLLVSYLSTFRKITDPDYIPFGYANYVHDNVFIDSGYAPSGTLGIIFGIVNANFPVLSGTKRLPAVIWDGTLDKDGLVTHASLPASQKICIRNNTTDYPGVAPSDWTFINVDLVNLLKGTPAINQTLVPEHDCTQPTPF